MAMELNGNTKVVLRIAESITIAGALLWFGYRASKVESFIQTLGSGLQESKAALMMHSRSDWNLQHEVLMASRIRAANPESKFTWPNPVEVHDDVRRSAE